MAGISRGDAPGVPETFEQKVRVQSSSSKKEAIDEEKKDKGRTPKEDRKEEKYKQERERVAEYEKMLCFVQQAGVLLSEEGWGGGGKG